MDENDTQGWAYQSELEEREWLSENCAEGQCGDNRGEVKNYWDLPDKRNPFEKEACYV